MQQTHTTSSAPQGAQQQSTQPSSGHPGSASIAATAPGGHKVIRRNGKVTPFDASKIELAITKAFLDVEGRSGAASSRIREQVKAITDQVVQGVTRSLPGGGAVHIEDIQDYVELALMRAGEHKVARSYVLYREQRAQERAAKKAASGAADEAVSHEINVAFTDGTTRALDQARLERVIAEACAGVAGVTDDQVLQDTLKNVFDGISEDELSTALILSARQRLEAEPNYGTVAARLLMDKLRHEALTFLADGAVEYATHAEMADRYPAYFKDYIARGVEHELLDGQLLEFDLDRLGQALIADRDLAFTYLGLQTLYDRYFIHSNGTRFELPQAFYMRVAMGLASNEIEREERAIEFYKLLSSFDFMSSTPTLFNSGTLRPQLSSCYLTSVADDLHGIYESIQDNALLSKFAGGLGNDWTPVRSMGAHIKGTNGKSQGVVPFLKVVNDTAVAVNQCFAPDTQIHTADGAKPIKDIVRGDLVLGQRGEYREVTNKFAYNQTDPMVELNVKHSVEPIRVTAGHPVWALRGVPIEQAGARTRAWLAKDKVKPEWVDAGDLSQGDYVAQVVPKEVLPVPGLTEDDARLYGILLGDGHLSKDGQQWGVSGNPAADASHLQFVRDYLADRGIHSWETARGDTYCQIHWAAGQGVLRDATTGRITGAGAPTLPFAADDIYDGEHNKRIHRRFAHLPRAQSLALVQGLLETDGGVSRGKEIYFTNTSRALAEGLRYQCLRLGVPTAGQYRERISDHEGRRSDGSRVRFAGTVKAYDIRVPAVAEIAERVGCAPVTKRNWIEHGGCLFTRVRSARPIEPIPFVYDLKVEGDPSYMTTAALAHNGGKRKGAVCAYLETWHKDIEEFLDQRKNTGDDRRRCHDMNTANWIPDLFVKRVLDDGQWTLFSPNDVPDLHDLTGKAFEAAYVRYEENPAAGEITNHKTLSAVTLWRKMLSILFETGHPWFTFKDPCNLRSPQQHRGVVHSSNLCTEITLNTSPGKEIAVCNLGSINLPQHIDFDENGRGVLNAAKLEATINTAMRMLDNVIEYNYYSVKTARDSNLRHRPVGMGLMGFQDALYQLKLPYESDEAVAFADRSMEQISYYAIQASTNLAEERGAYSSFKGSLWDQGVLPIDSIGILRDNRGAEYLDQDETQTLDWDTLRARVKQVGMRNSNCMAIAPTATIANITGVSQSIEPTYQNLYVKSNLSGEFTVCNPYLVEDLKALGLWDEVMANDLKYYGGSVQAIDRIPDDLKVLYKCAFEIDARWLVEAGSRRQKWLDQAQSLNLYMAEPSGRKLDELYKFAWKKGLKTTYYLRTMGATHVEKSTVTDHRLNAVGNGGQGRGNRSGGVGAPEPTTVLGANGASDNGYANGINGANGRAPAATQPTAPMACAIDDPDCEACQ